MLNGRQQEEDMVTDANAHASVKDANEDEDGNDEPCELWRGVESVDAKSQNKAGWGKQEAGERMTWTAILADGWIFMGNRVPPGYHAAMCTPFRCATLRYQSSKGGKSSSSSSST